MEVLQEVPFEYDSEKYRVKVCMNTEYYHALVCYEDGTQAYKRQLPITPADKHSKSGIDQIVKDTQAEFVDYLKTSPEQL